MSGRSGEALRLGSRIVALYETSELEEPRGGVVGVRIIHTGVLSLGFAVLGGSC
jgi:hypothetical protein